MPRGRAHLAALGSLAATVAGCWPWATLTAGLDATLDADAASDTDVPSDLGPLRDATDADAAVCDAGEPPAVLPRVTSSVLFYPHDAGFAPTGGTPYGRWVATRVTVVLAGGYMTSIDATRSMVQGNGFVVIDPPAGAESDLTFRADLNLTEGLYYPGFNLVTHPMRFASHGRVSLLIGTAVLQLGDPGEACPSLAVVFARASVCEAEMTLVPRAPLLGTWVLRLYDASNSACAP